jgi:hypothetical protein
MNRWNRRDFLADVGKGMLLAGIGPVLAHDLGVAPAFADGTKDVLSFGQMEPLVALMQETPVKKLIPLLVEKLKSGTDLRILVSAAALANARTFGGHDYIGFHTFMALVPAYEMSRELPAARQALPVLKVLYRNTNQIHKLGCRTREVLKTITAAKVARDQDGATLLRRAVHGRNTDQAESIFAGILQNSVDDAYNDLQHIVQDNNDVHRVVLAWRAWAVLDLTGKEYALTLLRQSVRYCIDTENQFHSHNANYDPESHGVRGLLPKLLDQYRLLSRPPGQRRADDSWIEHMSKTVFGASREQAADAAAAALAEGIAPDSLAEAIALAANQLLLRDPGRPKEWTSGDKIVGSTHGDSVGVHASDAANAWRNIARVSTQRNTVASLVVAAYHTAGQSGRSYEKPYPWAEHLEKIKTKDAGTLVRETETAIKSKDQARAAALVQRYGDLGYPARPVFDLLLRYATSEDGALHAEKYYRTVSEEFAAMRPAFRWRQLVALARVTASEYGTPAPGYGEACQLLNVS